MNRAHDYAQPTPTVNIAKHLSLMAQRYPGKHAVVCMAGSTPCAQLTFQQLDRQTDSYARGLERIGITRGARTILMVRPSVELFALTFALFKVGAVPVLIDPGMGRDNLVRCLAEVEAEAFIGVRIGRDSRDRRTALPVGRPPAARPRAWTIRTV
jgi:acyl-CoA synthetase (AMP-forming)/AMP-acid ligase II